MTEETNSKLSEKHDPSRYIMGKNIGKIIYNLQSYFYESQRSGWSVMWKDTIMVAFKWGHEWGERLEKIGARNILYNLFCAWLGILIYKTH